MAGRRDDGRRGPDAGPEHTPEHEYALRKLNRRVDPLRVEEELVQAGAAPDVAAQVVQRARAEIVAARRGMGIRIMLVGGLIALAGGGLTVLSYVRPESEGVVVWYGAIGVGLFTFVGGLALVVRPELRPELGRVPFRRRPPRGATTEARRGR